MGPIIISILQRKKPRQRLSNLAKVLEASRRHRTDCSLSQSDTKACIITHCLPGTSDKWQDRGTGHFRGPVSERVFHSMLFWEAAPAIVVRPGVASSFLVKGG